MRKGMPTTTGIDAQCVQLRRLGIEAAFKGYTSKATITSALDHTLLHLESASSAYSSLTKSLHGLSTTWPRAVYRAYA